MIFPEGSNTLRINLHRGIIGPTIADNNTVAADTVMVMDALNQDA